MRRRNARLRKEQLALQRNKDIIHRYFEEWGNHGDTKAADELIATNITLRNPPAVLHSLEEYKQGMAAFHSAFPMSRTAGVYRRDAEARSKLSGTPFRV